MKVPCPSCQKTINIQDDKLPIGKTVKFNCPFCKALVTTTRHESSEQEPVGGGLPDLGSVPDSTPSTFKLDETQNVPIASFGGGGIPSFADALEDEMEILEEGSLRALVADTENLDRLSPVLKKMQYLVTVVKTQEEALRKVQFNKYDLIVINERFGGCDPADNSLHKFIEPMTMDDRRKMFVIMIGRNFKTLDNMTAFGKSVNLVINEADFSNLELIIKKAINDNDIFYRAFKKLLVETGKD